MAESATKLVVTWRGGVARRVGVLLWALGLAGTACSQPLPLRDVRLVDQRGQALSMAALAGRPTLLHFIFTQCGTTCPTQVQELVQLHAGLPAAVRAQVRFVSVTVDPLSDTPATLTAFARRHGALRPGWDFATGSPVEVGRLVERMAVMRPDRSGPARPDDHRTSLYLFGSDGQLVQRFRGVPVDGARLAHELTVQASGRSAGR